MRWHYTYSICEIVMVIIIGYAVAYTRYAILLNAKLFFFSVFCRFGSVYTIWDE